METINAKPIHCPSCPVAIPAAGTCPHARAVTPITGAWAFTVAECERAPWASWVGGYGWKAHRTEQAARNRAARLSRQAARGGGSPAWTNVCPSVSAVLG